MEGPEPRDADEARAGRRRPYEPPRIQSETIFETTALACAKRSGQGQNCIKRPQNS